MSIKHPIISVTGSSGAGTTSVRQTFEHDLPPRAHHGRLYRGRRLPSLRPLRHGAGDGDGGQARQSATSAISAPKPICSTSSRTLFRNYGENGTGRTRHYVHDERGGARHGAPIGTFTPWADIEPRNTDLLFYEGLHGAVVTANVNIAQHADLKIGVVPVINLEWIQKIQRDRTDARLLDGRSRPTRS